MIDLNNEEEQRERSRGPIPDGSMVLARLEMQRPQYPARNNPMLSETRSGLCQLFCKLVVVAGSYRDSFWYERISLPAASQAIQLTANQRIACRIGGTQLRAIWESAKGIDPKATDPKSCAMRRVGDWLDYNGLVFPVRVRISDNPHEKNGREYWNNEIAYIIPCNDKEYASLKAGGEIITDGAVVGKNARSGNGAGGQGRDLADMVYGSGADDLGPASPPGYDEVPF